MCINIIIDKDEHKDKCSFDYKLDNSCSRSIYMHKVEYESKYAGYIYRISTKIDIDTNDLSNSGNLTIVKQHVIICFENYKYYHGHIWQQSMKDNCYCCH